MDDSDSSRENGRDTGAHGDTGGVPDPDRHRHSIYMTGVLARALTAQLEDLARTEDDAGWWFARSGHRDGDR
ncbi:hypothetical protein [Pseudonocardia sp. KRD291]|uniref:hypothetical protein n=1 Tax=Pseudonocardia sp. KRD291 TaxID=2792007 RepID=UPI001C4A4FBD|nr:hypothetical protein [Pseudonocardia sp. KRD291]MBW0105228.1 hypothetical protein [Pseudonocardia sp. KRD291]